MSEETCQNINNNHSYTNLTTTLTKEATDVQYTKLPEEKETDKSQITSNTTKTENLRDLPFLYFLKKISLIAFPGMMFYLFLILLQTINLAFIGQKYNDDDMIKGIGVSNLYMNCTMFAIVMGLVSGIDTLCANAMGMKKYKLMGLYVHRARIIGYAFTVIVVILHAFTVEKVLRLFSLNERVVKYSSRYIYVCLVYVFFDVQTACNFRFLNVIRKSHVNFIVLVIGAVLHPLWNYIFIIVLDWDVTGAGISFTISRVVICASSSIYIHFWNPLPEAYFCINHACFKGIWSYLRFSLGSAFLICAEWWAFEIQAIIAISISEDDYTVHIIIAQFSSLLYSLCIGFSFACTIIIGEFITKSTIKITKKATWFSLIYGVSCMIILLIIFYFLRNQLFKLFIDKENIIEKGMPVIPILLCCEFFDVAQTIMSAVFRGLGKQVSASILTFLQFYVVMTTLSYILGKVLGWGVYGMWVGINIGQATAFLFYLIMFSCFDFKKIQAEVRERLDHDHKNARSFLESVGGDQADLFLDQNDAEGIREEEDENNEFSEKRERYMSFDKIDKNCEKKPSGAKETILPMQN